MFIAPAGGKVGIGTSAPTRALHVIGDANITGRLDVGSLNITGVSFSQGDLDAAGSLRVAGGANISGDLGVSGKIGAGTLSPITTLDVKGKANFTGNFSVMNASDTIFFVDNTSGNVGIGTTGPGNKLSVVYTGNSPIPAVGSNGGSFALMEYDDGPGMADYGFMMGVLGSGNVWQQVQRIDGTATTYNLLLQPSGGNVGIGTTGPDRKLDVLDASNPQLRLSQADGTVYTDFQMTSAGDLVMNVDGVTNQLVLDNGGNVGIGTTGPTYLLDVSSATDATIRSIGVAGYGQVRVYGTTAADLILYDSNSAVDDKFMYLRNSGGITKFASVNDADTVYVSDNILVFDHSSGNVGIGTTSPAAA